MSSARVLIVEDIAEAFELLQAAIDLAFPLAAVHHAPDAAAARALLESVAPDLALVDLHLPDGSGIDVIRAILAGHPDCVTVVATIFDDDEHLFPALQAGAQGYLLKDQETAMLAAQLRGIGDGHPPLSPAIARRLLGYFQSPRIEADATGLAARETEVLRHLAHGIRVAEIARLMGISHHTAAGYVKSIYRKLSISSRAEAALRAARLGLLD